MRIPTETKKFLHWAHETIEVCRTSASKRAQEARTLRGWRYTGSDSGEHSLYNYLDSHLERLASYLFSPTDLRFHLEFENRYTPDILQRAEVASRILTREFERRDIDLTFADGVDTALSFGAAIPKVLWGHGGVSLRLVMPWQFGVWREDLNDLGDQEAMTETVYITLDDLWRRVSHLRDAQDIMKKAHSWLKKRPTDDDISPFQALVLTGSSPAIQTSQPYSQQVGGNVLGSGSISGSPEVEVQVIPLHEVWVIDDERQDYSTFQFVGDDIPISRMDKRGNMFVKDYHPYGFIQANRMQGYLWGRSELEPLLKLQNMMTERLEDIRRVMSLQYDRIFAFTGFSGMNDENYDQFRTAGWIANENPGAKVEDLTPKLPEAAFSEIESIMKFMEQTSGFSNILSGQGEPGVRAGNHAETLLKTASPRLRDRALVIERQCADVADKVFRVMRAKNPQAYWTDPKNDKTDFTLETGIPDDFRVSVDSHSSSPIYQDDHAQLAAFLLKSQVIDGESVLDMLPVPTRDLLKEKWKVMQEQKAKFMKEHPELLHKGGHHGGSHGGHQG